MSTLSPSGLKLVDGLGSPGQALDDNFTLLNAALGPQLAGLTLVGLTGGGSTKLDGIATIGLSEGVIVAAYDGNVLRPYRFEAGTNAENSPWIIRPDDYAASTHEFIWRFIGADADSVLGVTSSSAFGTSYANLSFGTTNPVAALPGPGKYMIMANVQAVHSTGSGDANFRLWNNDDGVALGLPATANASGALGEYPICLVSPTPYYSAAKTIVIQGRGAVAGEWSADYGTWITWQRLAG